MDNQPAYEVQPTSPYWGIFERGADEPVLAGIGSKQAAEDLADAMNRSAENRLSSPASFGSNGFDTNPIGP